MGVIKIASGYKVSRGKVPTSAHLRHHPRVWEFEQKLWHGSRLLSLAQLGTQMLPNVVSG